MPTVSSYTPTGDVYVDALLLGKKWAVTSLTYSFPTDASYYGTSYGSGEPTNNFEAFSSLQQSAIRSALQTYSSVANLTFTEITETATEHAVLRYSESDAPKTAWTYYPSTSELGGDAWFNNSGNYFESPIKGNYAWLTMLHETGHALGLKHPHEVMGSFGAMPVERDSLEYSVMSYRSYVGASTQTGYTNGSSSFPQTLMMYDIAALQTIYGANYNTESGDTVYSWDQQTGQTFIDGTGQGTPVGNKIFMTIWDGGGHDTYDFSNYTTNLTVNLQPAQWTTVGTVQTAILGSGRMAAGNIANALLYNNNPASLIEDAIGGSGSDQIIGNIIDNIFFGGGGNDFLDGGGGINTALYSGLSTDYLEVQNADGTWTITDLRNLDGTDTLINIQLLQFGDLLITLDVITTPPPPPPPENLAPSAQDDAYSVSTNKLLSVGGVGVLANDTDLDGDLLAAILVDAPTNGTLTLNSDGSFAYMPVRNFSGTDSFTYLASDGPAASNLATVNISVTASSGKQVGKKGRGSDSDHMTPDQIPAPEPEGLLFTSRPHEKNEESDLREICCPSLNAESASAALNGFQHFHSTDFMLG